MRRRLNTVAPAAWCCAQRASSWDVAREISLAVLLLLCCVCVYDTEILESSYGYAVFAVSATRSLFRGSTTLDPRGRRAAPPPIWRTWVRGSRPRSGSPLRRWPRPPAGRPGEAAPRARPSPTHDRVHRPRTRAALAPRGAVARPRGRRLPSRGLSTVAHVRRAATGGREGGESECKWEALRSWVWTIGCGIVRPARIRARNRRMRPRGRVELR